MELQKYKDFNEQVEDFYNQLKTNFLESVEQADDKQYAQEYYRSIYFTRNPEVPKESFFFNTLSKFLIHNYRLNNESAIEKTIDELYLIRERAEQTLNITLDIYAESPEEPMGYLEEARLEHELYLLALDIPELVNMLARFLAIEKLMLEFPKNDDVELFSLQAPIMTAKKAHNRKRDDSVVFTESQHLSALFFLLNSVGLVARRDYALASLARFTHLISRTPITEVDNSPKLSMIKRILSFKKNQPSLKDLEFILPYFDKLGLEDAVSDIEKEIKAKEEGL